MSEGFDFRRIRRRVDLLLMRMKFLIPACMFITLLVAFTLHEKFPNAIHGFLWRHGVDPLELIADLILWIVALMLHRLLAIHEEIIHSDVQVFKTQLEMYDYILDELKVRTPREAVLLQYSCESCKRLLEKLVREGCKVRAFMQNPFTAAAVGSTFQEKRVNDHCDSLKTELPDEELPRTLMYTAPATVSAVRIDDHLVALGWYVYRLPTGKLSPKFETDRVEIVAGDMPGIVVRKGHKHFQMLSKFLDRRIEESRALEVNLPLDEATLKLLKASAKVEDHLRVDSDVFDWFKKQGEGHLTRMNAVLRSYVEAHKD